MTKRPFVIWSFPFNGDFGGIIALHLLCHRLNEMGETAKIWVSSRPRCDQGLEWRKLPLLARYWLGRVRRTFWKDPFRNPVASNRDLRDAIVVYPEIVEGDPLRRGRVVRWLLNAPGVIRGTCEFGTNDLFFFYQEAFDDAAINPDPSNRLTMTWFNNVYRQQNEGKRSGSAYLIRKGKGRPLVHDLTNSVCIDDLSHAECAAVFNRVERFYSYDLYSMYGLYAAICGCIPIVVPDPRLTKEEWTPDPQDWYGVAYGEEDIPWAISTRGKLLQRLSSLRAEEDAMLRRFVDKCHRAFDNPGGS